MPSRIAHHQVPTKVVKPSSNRVVRGSSALMFSNNALNRGITNVAKITTAPMAITKTTPG
ncbi:unannotated protein [freshwater metagenome]|uniref:Unannotated protein n=1 Tax=freshwater metagenome TaxID=449393 RepID=A0A6J7AVB6_9ZZZZ